MAKIAFYGAVRGVTGSCYLVATSTGKFLVDCGMFQGEHEEWTHDPFGFDPKEICAVFITHPHADHTGRLPKLISEGFRGPIFMPEACRPLSRLVLEDSVSIMLDNAKREGKEILFSQKDVARVYEQVEGRNYHEEINVCTDVTAMFHEAGHVLGSAYVSIEAEGKRLVFSGDIGNDDVPILPPTEPISRADVVVCEATYGDRAHETMSKRRGRLREVMEATIRDKSVLLIPAFSIERTQEVLYEMNDILLHTLKSNIPIFLDSPMAIKATQIYRDYKAFLHFDAPIFSDPDRDFFAFPNLHETLTVDQSKAINDVPAPKIVIAGSGMMSGGRVMHHLLRCLDKPPTTLLIVGYQAYGTLGRRIQDGAKHVRIFGQKVDVKAKIEEIHSFSAHGDRDKLTRWLRPTDGAVPKKIFLVHGDADQKLAFKAHLDRELQTEVLIPTFGEIVEVDNGG